ncbi:MAG: tRNA (guanosine(37)-N1)-methyltransferase TrmD [Bdellovibrionales bacterium]
MKFNFITLFPEIIEIYMGQGVIGQAGKKSLLQWETTNPRTFTTDVHQTVDDKPYGGGDGMLMQVEPLKASVEYFQARSQAKSPCVVYVSPHGRPWTHVQAQRFSKDFDEITFINGRYAGVDQRFINQFVDHEVSLGDFVISGGELASLSMADSIARFIPGVLGNSHSPYRESFQENFLLESPQFTRPEESLGQKVPSVLLSGHHGNIEKAKKAFSIVSTMVNRSDLLEKSQLSREEIQWALEYTKKLSASDKLALGFKAEVLNQLQAELEL